VPTRASSNAVSGLRPLEAPVWLRRGFHWTGPGHPRPWRASRHQHLNFTGFTNVDGLIVNGGSPNQAVARVGGRLLRPFEMEDGKFVTPYMELNLLQGFADASSINVSGFDFGTGQYGTAMQARGGATGMLTPISPFLATSLGSIRSPATAFKVGPSTAAFDTISDEASCALRRKTTKDRRRLPRPF
jgi:Autotransporter beta-domain